jgi:hypothetical protein
MSEEWKASEIEGLKKMKHSLVSVVVTIKSGKSYGTSPKADSASETLKH